MQDETKPIKPFKVKVVTKGAADKLASENIILRCNECLHYRNSPNPQFGEICKDRGIKSSGVAPDCYTPDYSIFRKQDARILRTLAIFLSHFSSAEMQVLMGMLKNAPKLNKHKLEFLQRIYFKVNSADYLDSYHSGYVLGVNVGNTIVVAGPSILDGVAKPALAYLFPDSLLTEKAFDRLKKSLLAKGRINNPNKRRRKIIDVSALKDYEPPSIDTSEEFLSMQAKLVKPKRKQGTISQEGGVSIYKV